MNEIQKRALLYGGALAAIGAIGAAWANTSTDADVMTLLSGADVQLRMAFVLPERGDDGRPLPARENLIDTAVQQLTDVERIQPGMASTAEFRGFAHMMRGEFAEAAVCYHDAQQRQDCLQEQRDVLAFNEARMLAKAGRDAQALQVFSSHAAQLDARFGHQRSIEEAGILREMGRVDEAAARLDVVLADEAASPMAWLQAGFGFAALGDDAKAERAFGAASGELPIAHYHLACLKLRAGAVDSCFDALRRAAEARPIEVRRLLRDEAGAWSAVAEDARFLGITAQPASPGR
ncbi:MAG: hypothetical protein H6835_07295 [Planctomycetes bacterium]|nr:hypothetical protein [Planctomycetota bacterium]